MAEALEPAADAFRIIGAVVLIAIALVGILGATKSNPAIAPERSSLVGTYVGFVGLTIINPLTIVYFTALILGLDDEIIAGASGKGAFIVGAFLASLSWQLLLAGAGGLLHRRLTPPVRLATAILGNLIVFGLAIRLLLA